MKYAKLYRECIGIHKPVVGVTTDNFILVATTIAAFCLIMLVW